MRLGVEKFECFERASDLFFLSGNSGRFGSRGEPTGRPMISHMAFVGAGYSTLAI
jgi:hypothetical protein